MIRSLRFRDAVSWTSCRILVQAWDWFTEQMGILFCAKVDWSNDVVIQAPRETDKEYARFRFQVEEWVLDGSSSWDTWNEETSKDDSQFAGFWSKCQQELWYWYPVCGAEEKPALVHLGVGEAQLGEVQDLLCQDGKVCGIQAVLQASVWFPQAEFQWTCSQVRVINRF